jgi:hypothetical protein
VPERVVPPHDISPEEFFTIWVPEAIAGDPARRARLGAAPIDIEFTLEGDGGGIFAVRIREGVMEGSVGAIAEAHLRVRTDVTTWRELNSGSLSAPEAFLRRRVRLEGKLFLAVKLHVILG